MRKEKKTDIQAVTEMEKPSFDFIFQLQLQSAFIHSAMH